MPRQLFPKWSDSAVRWALIFVALAVPSVFVIPGIYLRTPYATNRQNPETQPVQFDHRHHVQDDGIPCLYCHNGAERSAYAGIPATELCMGCHSQIWPDSAMLQPVRRSYFTGQPLAWNRVHWVPDFVYFNHAIHIKRGIDCTKCHGDVREMPSPYQVRLFTMGWCLDCHRSMQPLEYGTADPLAMPAVDEERTPSLHRIAPLTNCTTCHR